LLQIVHTRIGGVCLKALERRDNSIRRYDQELIELGLYLWLELRRDLLVQVIKVTVQGPIHETLQFCFRRQLEPQLEKPLTSAHA
jgi:hypothetical protein